MLGLDKQFADIDLTGNWCNEDAATSSLMEAVSFVTPVLENHFIRTVGEALKGRAPSELERRCRSFIREESIHSRIHKKFNAQLLANLGRTPPGLAAVATLLDSTKHWLSLRNRLLLAAALEHFAAVISKGYVAQQAQLEFRSAFARELFAQHAQEELAHRSVVFDLWLSNGTARCLGRVFILLAILAIGVGYFAVAMTWLLYRKHGNRWPATLAALAGFALKHVFSANTYAPIPEVFSFMRRHYHPDQLAD